MKANQFYGQLYPFYAIQHILLTVISILSNPTYFTDSHIMYPYYGIEQILRTAPLSQPRIHVMEPNEFYGLPRPPVDCAIDNYLEL